MANVAIERIVVGGDAGPWEQVGLTCVDGEIGLQGTSIAIDGAGSGVLRWDLSGVTGDVTSIDGLPTMCNKRGQSPFVTHPLGAVAIDHVVISTDSIERTCAAIAEATGAPLKRIREAGPVRQGFHRIGSLVIEVVEIAGQLPERPQFWGLALTVVDLDAAVAMLGPALIGAAKEAVQPGRRIATIRREAGLGLPVALMSPR